MEKIILFLTVLCYALTSCTKEKTDYEAEIDTVIPERIQFEEVRTFQNGPYTLRFEALGGKLYKGYNEVRLKISSQGQPPVSEATLLPIQTGLHEQTATCPHRHQLNYRTDEDYFEGYIVFTDESSEMARWDLQFDFIAGQQQHNSVQNVTVQKQSNKNLNMNSFIGSDGEQYIIALVAPQKPKVAENDLVAGIYKLNKPTTGSTLAFYTPAEGYTLELDPRMPEPSMGNHSSPNNKDLLPGADGLYHGVVNYTMTGNWTLNFILLNQHGRIIKGTVVPNDFTPGAAGVKSELHIDILF